VLMSIQPILIGIMGAAVLKEKFGLLEQVACITCIVGVIFIAKPSFFFEKSVNPYADGISDSVKSFAVVICLLQAMLEAGRNMLFKLAGKTVNPFIILTVHFMQIVLIFPLFFITFANFEALSIMSVLAIFVIAVMNLTGNLLLIEALKEEKAAVVSITNYSQIMYSVVLEIVFLGTFPDVYSCMGALIIVSCCLLVLFSKAKKT